VGRLVLVPFITILAALGAAIAFRGRERRGLLVLLVANATVAIQAAALTRWELLSFSIAMCGVCLVGIALARRDDMARTTPEPEPAPEPDERRSDYCYTHQQNEPQEER
jgi:hypothetical protein